MSLVPRERPAPTHQVYHRSTYEVRLTLPSQDVPPDHDVVEVVLDGAVKRMTFGDWQQFVSNVSHAQRQISAARERVPSNGLLPGSKL